MAECILGKDWLCGTEDEVEDQCPNPQRPPPKKNKSPRFTEAENGDLDSVEPPHTDRASVQAKHDTEAEDTDGEEFAQEATHRFIEAKFHKEIASDSGGDVTVDHDGKMMVDSLSTSSKAPDPPTLHREPVFVQVYDLGHASITRGFNRVNKEYGAFHTAVEVYGIEWSFGMTFDDWSSGVCSCLPTEDPDHKHREALLMGHTTLSQREVFLLLDRLRGEWLGSKYNLLTCNCHHFTDCLVQELGCGPLPKHLNNLATEGAKTNEWLESTDNGWDGGDAIADIFAGAKTAITGLLRFGGADDQEQENASTSASASSASAVKKR